MWNETRRSDDNQRKSGWTAKYNMGKCPSCEEPVIGIIEKNKYFSVSHYCKNPRMDYNGGEFNDCEQGDSNGGDSIE